LTEKTATSIKPLAGSRYGEKIFTRSGNPNKGRACESDRQPGL